MLAKIVTRLNTSIEFRLTAIFICLFLVISVIFSSMSAILASKITTDKELEHTHQLSELAINVISLKYDTSIQFTLDYSYWSELAKHANNDHKSDSTYAPLLDHLLDYGFMSISIFSKSEELLYQTHQPDFNQEVYKRVHGFNNLSYYGDLKFQIIVEKSELYVVATRAIFNESNLSQATGFISFSKKIDQFLIDDVSKIIGTKLQLEPADKDTSVSFSALPLITGQLETSIVVGSINQSTFRLIDSNKNIIPFKLVVHRPLEHLLTSELLTIIVFEFVVVILLVLFFYLILKNHVSKPVVQMSQWLSNYRSSKPEPFQYPYRDELSSLAKNIEDNHLNLMGTLQFNQDLLNAISDIIITADENLKVTYCNPAAELWFGKSNSYDIRGKPLDFLLQVIEGDSVGFWFSKVLTDHQSYNTVCTLKSGISNTVPPMVANITVRPIEHGNRSVVMIKPVTN
ncbi:PAS domain-containing protein [Vibrio kyushuensis]|uniref:CHASE4 domain-containing protein n=1 Tax=Vibrio kyushuensis TaxID=2910249 RepID=UPI003D0A9064